jgi:hypothetical protein
MSLLALFPAVLLSHRYQLCNFSCSLPTGDMVATTSWLACRSEKCTPRLPEDACADGSEAKLFALDGSPSSDDGLAVTGPQECEELFASSVAAPTVGAAGSTDVPAQASDVEKDAAAAGRAPAPLPLRIGSFDERCGLCMGLVVEASRLWAIAAAEGAAATSALSGSAEQLCGPAAANVELEQLPTVRTCRLHPPSCAAVLAASSTYACAQAWEMLKGGAQASAVRAKLQARCGALMTQRNGSSVDDALVCPQPRDVGGRVMAISAVLAIVIFAAQVAVFRS